MTTTDAPPREAAHPVRVVLGDDHPLMRDGLRRSLETFGVEVVAEVSNGREVVAAVERHLPDVVVVDLWMPVMDGVRAAEIVRARHPGVAVAVLTFDTSEAEHDRALQAGAAIVITKDASADQLVDAVRSIAGVPRSGGQGSAQPPGFEDSLSLSPRELDVLRMIVRGASTNAVAASLFISAKTVKNHLASIYEKLDVTDRTQAVLAALRLGLLSLDDQRGETG